MAKETTHSNRLADESSPYLLQHAHNPVDWYPWGEEAFERARAENKLVLVSIGYSACHWCHVMERESFEDEQAAKIMNERFVCIKVDREERPDVDQVYMTALQLMTGQGGWPLNCFTLPDKRPVYGGTYYPKEEWVNLLKELSETFDNQPDKFMDYAQKLSDGIKSSDYIERSDKKEPFSKEGLESCVRRWSKKFDYVEGGPTHAPKFPMPNNHLFLLKYSFVFSDLKVKDYVQTTLNKMAFGGIYDHIGGGFSRYSTDMLWKVPHFEKMLYDNAQLVSLYSEAYQALGVKLYRKVVYETLEFVEREMSSSEGAFYSALDADTEGEEGKYYVWTKEELQRLLEDKYPIAAEYYNINDLGKWDGKYILLRKHSDEQVAEKLNLPVAELRQHVKMIKSILMKELEARVKPGLDDKILTSWNAQMLLAYVDAYKVFNEQNFLGAALKNARFIEDKQRMGDGGLYHSYKNGKSSITGFLEDYAFTIEAYINLYEATLDFKWLDRSKELMDYAIEHFYDEESGMFYFTADTEAPIVSRKFEITDNVTPASNSSIAKSLFLLGRYFENNGYNRKSIQMLRNIQPEMIEFGSSHSNWGILMLWNTQPFYEIIISGLDAEFKRKELNAYYIPNKLIAGATKETDYPLFKERYKDDKTTIYVCVNQQCKLPVHEVEDAMKQIEV
ncbi:MAG: thioredoxin domain-containing protein [Bacteroidetes bacterium]|nr:thioredoxin domain-containing protein [Bacteroidota bacterium]